MVQPGLRLPHGGRLDAEGQVLRLCQAVVAPGKLAFQHLAVLARTLSKASPAGGMRTDFSKLSASVAMFMKDSSKWMELSKKLRKLHPLLEDGRLVLLLGQLVVDVVELDGLGVVVVRHTADAVREHPLERDGLLGGAGSAVIPAGLLDDGPNLFFLRFCQACGRAIGSAFPRPPSAF